MDADDSNARQLTDLTGANFVPFWLLDSLDF